MKVSGKVQRSISTPVDPYYDLAATVVALYVGVVAFVVVIANGGLKGGSSYARGVGICCLASVCDGQFSFW